MKGTDGIQSLRRNYVSPSRPYLGMMPWRSSEARGTILSTMASISVRLPPLQTEFRRFCERKYLHEKETHKKNEDNTLKELNEIFLMVYGLPK